MEDRITDEAKLNYSLTTGEQPSIAVIRAVARELGTEPDEFDQPLNEVVDPDALDALFAPQPDGRPRQGGCVSFEFNGAVVTLGNDDTVHVTSND